MDKIDQVLAEVFGNNIDSSTFTALEATIDASNLSFDDVLRTDISVLVALESILKDSEAMLSVESLITFATLESVLQIANETIDGYISGSLTFAVIEAFIDDSINNIGEIVTESTLESLLTTAKNTIDSKCTSIDACDSMIQTIATEATKFNNCMVSMATAGKELKDGSITKDEFKQRIAPSITELKSSCAIIGRVNSSYAAESTVVADEDIATVRAFIIGTEALLNEKRKSFSAEVVDTSLESFITSCEEMVITNEGVNIQTSKLLKSDEVKAARKLIKTARKTAKGRTIENLDSAIEMLKKAKPLISSVKKAINNMPEPITTWEKFKAAITPIFTLLPTDELQDGYGHDANGITYNYKPVDDEFSKSTASQLKKALQQILNLLLKNIDKDIATYNKEKKRVGSKATESDTSIEALIESIAMESNTDCCDDDDTDDLDEETLQEILNGIDPEDLDEDNDLDETSFDCYTK